MAFVHRALYTWLIVLVFLILLCLRLESRTHWNWFLIFIPLWIYDFVLLVYISIKIISKWKHNLFRIQTAKEIFAEYRWSLGAVILLLVIQFNCCMVLSDSEGAHSIFTLMVPVWILLTTCIVSLGYRLVKSS